MPASRDTQLNSDAVTRALQDHAAGLRDPLVTRLAPAQRPTYASDACWGQWIAAASGIVD